MLTGQIDVKKILIGISSIESTATCKHHLQEMTGCYYRERDS